MIATVLAIILVLVLISICGLGAYSAVKHKNDSDKTEWKIDVANTVMAAIGALLALLLAYFAYKGNGELTKCMMSLSGMNQARAGARSGGVGWG
jgi:ABC-type branched-subunit amino acid transport system permease subunit